MKIRNCLLTISLCFYFFTAWADAPSFVITIPQLATNPKSAGPLDYIIDFPRLCLANSNQSNQTQCPYPITTDTSLAMNLQWSCVNNNCLYTDIKQNQAQGVALINNNTIQVMYGVTGNMIPLLQTTIPNGWTCQVAIDQKSVTCQPPPLISCAMYILQTRGTPCKCPVTGTCFFEDDGSVNCNRCHCPMGCVS